jgi:hypothetical protein
MVQKLEAEARNHIRVEQQLKLHIENIQFKLEDCEHSIQKHREETHVLAGVSLPLAQFTNRRSKA